LIPYFSRAEIEGQGVLDPYRKELVWVDSPIDRFFLHIQGSGKIRLSDGAWFRVGYDASNGHPYRSIGRLLHQQNKLQAGQTSTQSIVRYLEAHQAEQEQIFFHNPRYIFFRLTSEGPLGSLGVPLTPGRSLATDPTFYPPGALAYIHTTQPVVSVQEQVTWKPLARFVLIQDRGAAITGPQRADLFWGSGTQPAAGYMAQEGQFYLFLKKPQQSKNP
jgi:membrane-bound lytic murein transglycosylase A